MWSRLVDGWRAGKTTRKVMNTKTSWQLITDGVPGGSILGLIIKMCNIFINDWNGGRDYTLSGLMDSTRLGGVVDMLKVRAAIQRHLG